MSIVIIEKLSMWGTPKSHTLRLFNCFAEPFSEYVCIIVVINYRQYILACRSNVQYPKFRYWIFHLEIACWRWYPIPKKLIVWLDSSTTPLNNFPEKIIFSTCYLLIWNPKLDYHCSKTDFNTNISSCLVPIIKCAWTTSLKTCSSPRRPLFIHALSFQCTSKLCGTFLNQFSDYFHIKKMHNTI